MWWWVLLFVVLGSCGVALLGFLAWRLYAKVRVLGRAVATASERLGALTAELEKVTAAGDQDGTGPGGSPLSRPSPDGRSARAGRTM